MISPNTEEKYNEIGPHGWAQCECLRGVYDALIFGQAVNGLILGDTPWIMMLSFKSWERLVRTKSVS